MCVCVCPGRSELDLGLPGCTGNVCIVLLHVYAHLLHIKINSVYAHFGFFTLVKKLRFRERVKWKGVCWCVCVCVCVCVLSEAALRLQGLEHWYFSFQWEGGKEEIGKGHSDTHLLSAIMNKLHYSFTFILRK